MKITIKLFATFRKYIRDNQKGICTLSIEDRKPVKAALELLNIPVDIPKVIIVNCRVKSVDEPLNDGDSVSVFPLMGGG